MGLLKMLCEICKQNQATIHIQELNNGEKITLHICKNCAIKKGLDTLGLQGINIAEILYKLSASAEELLPATANSINQPNFSANNEIITNIVCPKCKWEVKQFQQTGRLGCESCYQAFSEILSEALNNMHKGIIHTGKHPGLKKEGTTLPMLDIMNMQKQLNIHVMREEYEEAAKLRDQINALKKKQIQKDNE
jgi:protein arginine kinase activator